STSGGKPVPISPEGVALTTILPISPDGKYVAALGTDAKPTIFPANGEKAWAIPNTQPRETPSQWTSDGSSVFVNVRDNQKCQVFRINVRTGERTLWKEISAADPAGVNGITRVFPNPEGTGYAYSYIRILSTLYLVNGLH